MPFSGIIDPDKIAFLTRVLDDYCRAHAIADSAERERLGRRIVFLFESGVDTADELAAALDYPARKT